MASLARLLALLLAVLGLSGGAGEAARVPAGVTSIRISAPDVATTVADPAAVEEIVTWFDTLPHFVARPCPYSNYQPPDVTFDFREAGSGIVLHAVDYAPGTCPGSITYTNATLETNPPLADDNFVARVSKLLGVSFDPNKRTKENAAAAKLDERMVLGRVRVPLRQQAGRDGPGQAEHGECIYPMDQVFTFERAHRPRGATEDGSGSGSLRGVITDRELIVHLPADRPSNLCRAAQPRARHQARRLDTNLRLRVRHPGRGAVAQRKGARGRDATRLLRVSRSITDRAKVAKVIRWFNALPVVPTLDRRSRAHVEVRPSRLARLLGTPRQRPRVRGVGSHYNGFSRTAARRSVHRPRSRPDAACRRVLPPPRRELLAALVAARGGLLLLGRLRLALATRRSEDEPPSPPPSFFAALPLP